jgi:hypothetical protein
VKPVEVANEQGDVIRVFPDAVEYYESIGWKLVVEHEAEVEEA